MHKPDLAKIAKTVRAFTTKHTPEILTGIGIAGMITTTVLAVRATPKAVRLIEEAGCETKLDAVKAAWKPYIPAVITGVASTACLIGATSVGSQRTAALAAAYKLSEKAMAEYKDKVIETIGEKKEQVVREKVADERIKTHPVTQSEVYLTDKGNTLFYEPLSDRYFKSDIELIRRAEINLNQQIQQGMCGSVSVNEFYDEIGLPHTETTGDILGWNAFNLIKLDITAHLTDEDKPCLWIGHYNAPQYDY
jgi:hypothetical protein